MNNKSLTLIIVYSCITTSFYSHCYRAKPRVTHLCTFSVQTSSSHRYTVKIAPQKAIGHLITYLRRLLQIPIYYILLNGKRAPSNTLLSTIKPGDTLSIPSYKPGEDPTK